MNYKKLIVSLILPQLAGLIGSFFTVSSINNWYSFLNKPSFNPPGWIFGPAWLFLYLLMGISFYLIWNKNDKRAFQLFLIHLFFNASWSIVFFGFQNVGLALVNIIIIWIFIILLMFSFWKTSKWATYLLIPYLMWVSFATVLNYFIWILN